MLDLILTIGICTLILYIALKLVTATILGIANITGLRQICKKHDEKCRKYNLQQQRK